MNLAGASSSRIQTSAGRRWPMTLWIGLAILLACEALLFIDVWQTGRSAAHTEALIDAWRHRPVHGIISHAARFVSIHMTPLVWTGYILFLDGLLELIGRRRNIERSPIRRRPHHFATLSLASIFIWCVFDAINFNGGMKAWIYIGMPPNWADRWWGYVLAFGAIVPGMLLSGQVLLNLGLFNWARSRPWKMPSWGILLVLLVGAAMFIWPLVHRDPITNLTLWTSLVFLLDPINLLLGRPSVLRDWQAGRYDRTLAAFAGGLLCGFLWEFWNYWALTKWVYILPFLGSAEHFRYFEMPVIGLLGFIPFGLECWVMWQTIRIPLDGLAEPLPDNQHLL
ncbi:MAG: hypothetical protein IT446_07235 [Phycisphaerales bacterium]|jgi:hypothetical protein|nr:hypothetical protein [Phycisphaerales bacterium]